MKIDFVTTEEFSTDQKSALDLLRAAVYPPEVIATLPGRLFSWAAPQWSILLWDDSELVSRVGLVVREIVHDGVIKRIGGIGGVMTHPEKQGKGYAGQAMREAAARFDNDFHVAFALLFCRPHLVEFYKRSMWKPFPGPVYVEQPQGRVEFSANGAMVLDVKENAPVHGEIDLKGLPW